MGQSSNETMQSYTVVLNSQLVLCIGWNSGNKITHAANNIM